MINKRKGAELTKEVMNLFRKYGIFYAAIHCVDSEGDVLSLKINKKIGQLEKVGKVADAFEAVRIVKPPGVKGVG